MWCVPRGLVVNTTFNIDHVSSSFYDFFFLLCWNFWTQGLCLLGRLSITWVALPPHLFALVIFLIVLCFCLGLALDVNPSTYAFLCRWVYGCEPLCLACWLRWNLISFLPRLVLNFDPSGLHLPDSRDYWHAALFPALKCLLMCCTSLCQHISDIYSGGIP
jgi:hypothetical protein